MTLIGILSFVEDVIIQQAIETAITLLANASNKLLLMRRARILARNLLHLLQKRREIRQQQPHLFSPNFVKEAAECLLTLQLVQKVKQPQQQQNF